MQHVSCVCDVHSCLSLSLSLVYVMHRTTPGLVNVVSRECTISGSPHVDSYRLNEKFDLHVNVSFSWIEANLATQAAPRIVVTSTLLVRERPTCACHILSFSVLGSVYWGLCAGVQSRSQHAGSTHESFSTRLLRPTQACHS